jgi:hypothetical protein
VSARPVGSKLAHSEMQGRTHRIGSVAWRGQSPSLGTWLTRGGLSARLSGSTEHEAGQARTVCTRTRRTRFASAPSSVRNLRSQIAACRQLSFSPNLPLTLGNEIKAESALTRISAILLRKIKTRCSKTYRSRSCLRHPGSRLPKNLNVLRTMAKALRSPRPD